MTALLPLLLTTWWADFDRPFDTIDRNLALLDHQIQFPQAYDFYYPIVPEPSTLDFYYRPWMDVPRRKESGTMIIVLDKDTFKITINLRHYKPEEISVKVVDRTIVVEAKHEEKDDQSSISRQFVRRYLLPDRANADEVTSTLSSDGVLTITAPLKNDPDWPNGKPIKIELTGKPTSPTGGTKDKNQVTSKPTSSVAPSTEKTSEENQVQEELTTQGQEKGEKPQK